MGSYFANLYVRTKDAQILKEAITAHYAPLGITPCDSENADIEISIYSPENSGWTSVCSDAFTHEDILALAKPISDTANTDVLSAACFDSDYLFLNLLNTADTTDAWLNIGKSYEIKPPRRSQVTSWKNKVQDFDAFKAAAKEKYICTEEFLFKVAENLGLSSDQIDTYDFSENCIKLYFAAPAKEDGEPTKFTLPTFNLSPCKIGRHSCCSYYNTGSASRGIAVAFIGNYVENDEIIFEDTQIRIWKQSETSQFTSFPIKLEKIKTKNGMWAYYWEDKNFKIPECVSPDLPPMIYQKKRNSREIIVDFTPKGNPRKVLDICVIMLPLSNQLDGQDCWYVWRGYESKAEFIEAHNEEQKEMEKYGAPVEYYNPEDYDLD